MAPVFARTKIIEIDGLPSMTPQEIGALVAPLVQRALDLGADVKSGELPDSDLPESHNSYFVGARYLESDTDGTRVVDKLFDEITRLWQRERWNSQEISERHPQYAMLTSVLGW